MSENAQFLMAISGGIDSMVLLDIFCQKFDPDQLIVAHFDHRTRPDSQRDAKWVAAVCKKKGLNFVTTHYRGKGKSENDLRTARWEFLQDMKATFGCEFVVTAHHLEDQWETFLMRVMRGTGFGGLSGMRYRENGILRPLIHTTKEEIIKYAETKNVSYRPDSTNDETIYLRNKIRHLVTPKVVSVAEPYGTKEQFLKRFAALIKEIQELDDTLRSEADKYVEDYFVKTAYWTRCKRSDWENIPADKKAAVLRVLFRELHAPEISREALQAASDQITDKKKSFSLEGGIQITTSFQTIYFQNRKQIDALNNLPPWEEHSSGAWTHPLGHHVELKGKWKKNYEIRFAKAGDRIKGSKKIKEVFQKQKIPLLDRWLLPVISHKKTQDVHLLFDENDKDLIIKNVGFSHYLPSHH